MMKRSSMLCLTLAAMLGLGTPSVQAQDSTRNSVYASTVPFVALSVASASVAVVSAHAGSVLVVETMRAVGSTFELVLRGSAHASRAVIVVPAAAIAASGIAVGHSVKVQTEGKGHLLVANGKVLCFVPGPGDETLMRSSRSQ